MFNYCRPKVSQNMCEVEIKDETSDSEDGPSNSKRPYLSDSANLNGSAVLNDDDAPSLSINNVAATLDTLKMLKNGQFANVSTANGEDHSYDYGYTKILEMQTREHALRMEILQVQLQTAKFNRDAAELNKMMALKNVNGLNTSVNGTNNGLI